MGPKFVFASFIFREKDGLGQGQIKEKEEEGGSTACNNNYVHIEWWGSKTHIHDEVCMLGGWVDRGKKIHSYPVT
jgi:hypothetical protein